MYIKSVAEMPTTLDAAVAASNIDYTNKNPRSAAIAAEAAHYLPGGNTRSSLWYDPFPLCMMRGEGSQLIDADGHAYIDLLGEFTAGIFGHSPAPLKQAICAALEAGINLSSHNPLEGELARLICARFASMELIRFTNSGTEANLMALAAALTFTGRRKILVFEGAYHGSLLNFLHGGAAALLPHDFVRAPYNDLERSQTLMEQHGASLAAILVEPMLGAGGCIPGKPEFLRLLRRGATDNNAILIFDEIQTARLALGGRQAQLGLKADLTTIGKFFGGGLAFGAFGGRRDIMEQFDPRRLNAVAHPGTFNNNTLTMAAGITSVRDLLTGPNLERLNERGDQLRESVSSLFRKFSAPFTVTGLGSLMNIHPVGSPEVAANLRKLLFFDLLDAGIFLASRGLISLSMANTDQDISTLLRALTIILNNRSPVLRTQSSQVTAII